MENKEKKPYWVLLVSILFSIIFAVLVFNALEKREQSPTDVIEQSTEKGYWEHVFDN